MKTSSLYQLGIQMPAWPMSMPSSTGVVMGCVVAEAEAVVVEVEGGKMIMKARVPLFGDMIMALR